MRKIFLFVSISLSLYANNFKLAHEVYKAKDYSLAITILEQECNNNSKACSNLANFYYEGKIVQKNIELSKQYNLKACKLNNAQGCYNIGSIYIDKEISKKTLIKALPYFKKACNLGNEKACRNLEIIKNDY